MAKIYNSDVTKGLAQNAGIQQNVDKTPNELAEKIVPTFETNPELLRRTNIIKFGGTITAVTNVTLYTTPTNQDFYLTGFFISIMKDAVSDLPTGDAGSITAIVNGETIRLVTLYSIALTAESKQQYIQLKHPLKIDRNTNIVLSRGTTGGTVGVYIKTGTIYGYIVETSNA
jgi:hypothetical protein